MAKQAPKKKAANGYKLPDPIPKGEILEDITKKKWKIGAPIGQGGFGVIYSAQEADSKSTNFPYVVKIEPHENGPLFVEINFYIRNAKPQDVEEFRSKKKLKLFGMPTYLGSGSHEHKNQKYRFLVMQKFGTDIWKLFLDNGRIFPTTTVFKLAVQILDVLEYIHIHGYVHADIKGANILLGLTKTTENQTYLVDFGLACKYQTDGQFKPNPKKAHDGTIEYLSRDAHQGVPTRRGDLEILSYNMIQWLGCTLPWENILSDAVKVQESKEEHMKNIEKFLKKCFKSKSVPSSLTEYLKYINNLVFNEEPDYNKIRKMFIKEIEKNGDKLNTALVFKCGRPVSPKRKNNTKDSSNKKMKNGDLESDEEIDMDKIKKPEVTRNKKVKQDHIKSDEENDNKKDKTVKSKVNKALPPKREKIVEESYDGYTPEMRAIALKKMENGVKKTGTTKSEAVPETAPRSRRNLKTVNYNEDALSKI